MKAQFTRWGPRYDYRGAHVVLDGKLGEIVGLRRDEARGAVLAQVRNFNGEPWSFEPALVALEILDRTYSAT